MVPCGPGSSYMQFELPPSQCHCCSDLQPVTWCCGLHSSVSASVGKESLLLVRPAHENLWPFAAYEDQSVVMSGPFANWQGGRGQQPVVFEH